jgi:hypothetical protein
MTPIHEQEWHQSKGRLGVRDADGNVKALTPTDDQTMEEAQAVARAVATLPRMAARLREIHRVPSNNRGEVVISGEFVDLIGDLLREAGVPL